MTTVPSTFDLPAPVHGGSPAELRPANEVDLPRIARFYAAMSADSRYLRFFSSMPRAYEAAMHRWEPSRDALILAEHGGEVVGVAELVRGGEDLARAEIAFAVADGWHHHGIASSMLRALCTEAQRRGIHTLTAQVMGVNESMMHVFRESGLPLTSTFGAGVYDVVLSLDAR